MGFFSALDSLLNENSDNSLEKKLGKALDKVDVALAATLDKAESGIKKVEQVGKAADRAAVATTTIIDKTDSATKNVKTD